MAKFCVNCGFQLDDNSEFCPSCGTNQNSGVSPQQQTTTTTNNNNNNSFNNPQAKSKLVAGLLGLFLGAWGIHNFYLGNTNRGIVQIIVSVVTCGIGGIWGFVEGIMILAGSINCDSDGVPLKD